MHRVHPAAHPAAAALNVAHPPAHPLLTLCAPTSGAPVLASPLSPRHSRWSSTLASQIMCREPILAPWPTMSYTYLGPPVSRSRALCPPLHSPSRGLELLDLVLSLQHRTGSGRCNSIDTHPLPTPKPADGSTDHCTRASRSG